MFTHWEWSTTLKKKLKKKFQNDVSIKFYLLTDASSQNEQSRGGKMNISWSQHVTVKCACFVVNELKQAKTLAWSFNDLIQKIMMQTDSISSQHFHLSSTAPSPLESFHLVLGNYYRLIVPYCPIKLQVFVKPL